MPTPIRYVNAPFSVPPDIRGLLSALEFGRSQDFLNRVREWAQRYGQERYLEALEFLRHEAAELQIQERISILQVQAQTQARNQEQIRRLLSGQLSSVALYFTTNDTELATQMTKYVDEKILYTRVYNIAIAEFIPKIKDNLKTIITLTASGQNENAFPKEFLNPILRAIDNKLKIKAYGNKPYFMVVDIPDIFTVLGDENDLEAAYHEGALLKGVTKRGKFAEQRRAHILAGRISESDLSQPNARRRYLYWRALFQGQKSFRVNALQPTSGRINGRFASLGAETVSLEIPVVGSREETIQARLGVWARLGKSPQWLLLEYGQTKYSPAVNVTPGNIQVRWITELNKIWDQIVRRVWDDQINKFNRLPTPAGSYGEFLTNRIGKYYHSPTGYSNNVTTYRPSANVYGRGAGVASSSGIFGELVEDTGEIPYAHRSGGGVGLYGGPESPLEQFDREQNDRWRRWQAETTAAFNAFEDDLNTEW